MEIAVLFDVENTRGHRLSHFVVVKNANNGAALRARRADQFDHHPSVICIQ